MIDLGKQKFEVNCPNCNHKVAVRFEQVSRQEQVTCGSCSQTIQLKDSGGSAKKVSGI